MKFKTIEIFTFLMGLFIIGFIVWNRFIRVRLPKEILATDSTLIILSVICLCLCFLFLFLSNILLTEYKNKNKESWINKIILLVNNKYYYNKFINFIINRVIQAPIFVYNEIYKRVFMRPLIEYVGTHLSTKLSNYKKIFYFIVFVIPKMIVSVCFLIDVAIYKEFFYFYNSLGLLIIPLILNVVLFIIKHHAIRQRDRIEYFFVFEETETKVYISFQPHLTTEERKFGLKIDSESWYFLNKTFIFIEDFVTQITEIKYFYDFKVNVIYYGMYFVGFLVYCLILINFY